MEWTCTGDEAVSDPIIRLIDAQADRNFSRADKNVDRVEDEKRSCLEIAPLGPALQPVTLPHGVFFFSPPILCSCSLFHHIVHCSNV